LSPRAANDHPLAPLALLGCVELGPADKLSRRFSVFLVSRFVATLIDGSRGYRADVFSFATQGVPDRPLSIFFVR